MDNDQIVGRLRRARLAGLRTGALAADGIGDEETEEIVNNGWMDAVSELDEIEGRAPKEYYDRVKHRKL